ncbi:hypothetical protein [Pedobacter sp. L105]|uniref:hypothetical protein n=1 Tax=Pedobacter sp. L105 TaxID=1641871 RepID=UPI00131EAFC0|nr:hypothetical protein [Pedobacter sp. L105]
MKRYVLILFFFLFAINSKAQIYLNMGAVDTSVVEVKQALVFYNSYFAAFKHRKLPEMSAYWSAEELQQRKVPDQLMYGINDYPLYGLGYTPTILYVRPGPKYIQIKTQFGYVDSLKNISTICITNHYVAFDQFKKPYFISALKINSASWKMKKVRNITFYYPAYHTFNTIRADSLCFQIAKLEKDWSLKPIQVRYYFADTNEELIKLRGFDYNILMGNRDKPSGMSDIRDNQVFCGGLGENYFHEVAHLYLNPLYPNSPLQEGLVVTMAGSMGHPLNWHLKRVNEYLQHHPEADLNKLDDFWYTDTYTNPGGAINAMICSMVFKKEGLTGLKRLMQYTTLKEIFEKELHVPDGHWNTYLRKNIQEQAAL